MTFFSKKNDALSDVIIFGWIHMYYRTVTLIFLDTPLCAKT